MRRTDKVVDCSLPNFLCSSNYSVEPFESIAKPLMDCLDFSQLNRRAGYEPPPKPDGNIWNASISPAIAKLLEQIS